MALFSARSVAKSKADASGIEPLQRAKLLGDDVGRVIRQHDAADADAYLSEIPRVLIAYLAAIEAVARQELPDCSDV